MLGNAFDVAAILEACDGPGETLGSLYLCAFFSVMLGGLVTAAANPLSFTPLGIFVALLVVIAVVMSFVVDRLVSDCRRY